MAFGATEAAEIEASHEVMDLVRGNHALSNLVLRLRDQGLSWRDVKTAIDAAKAAAAPRTSNRFRR